MTKARSKGKKPATPAAAEEVESSEKEGETESLPKGDRLNQSECTGCGKRHGDGCFFWVLMALTIQIGTRPINRGKSPRTVSNGAHRASLSYLRTSLSRIRIGLTRRVNQRRTVEKGRERNAKGLFLRTRRSAARLRPAQRLKRPTSKYHL